MPPSSIYHSMGTAPTRSPLAFYNGKTVLRPSLILVTLRAANPVSFLDFKRCNSQTLTSSRRPKLRVYWHITGNTHPRVCLVVCGPIHPTYCTCSSTLLCTQRSRCVLKRTPCAWPSSRRRPPSNARQWGYCSPKILRQLTMTGGTRRCCIGHPRLLTCTMRDRAPRTKRRYLNV